MSWSSLQYVPRFGLARIDQVVPFQRSTKVCDVVLVLAAPDAKHRVEDVQLTPASHRAVPNAGLGLGTIVQLVPFQRSVRVAELLALAPAAPTAKHVPIRHETENRRLQDAFAGLGLD